ncbi:MAG: SpoIIE family protein phosphatase [Kutzneria sp.]|nr:SpoIIE family protein phosphatase [Kutzneria sp.]
MVVDQAAARLSEVVRRQQRQLDQIRAETAANLVVELAKGILVERLGCTPPQAADHLVGLADSCGMSVLDLAAEIIGESHGVTAGTPVRLRLAEAAIHAASNGTVLAQAVFTEALVPLGATAVAVWVLQPDGALRLVGEHGLGPAEASRWCHVPPQLDSPQQRVVTSGQPLWRTDENRTVLPLCLKHRPLGVLEIRWQTAATTELSPALRGELIALADLCASAVGLADDSGEPAGPLREFALLDQLVDAVVVAHAIRDGAGTVIDFVVDHVSADLVDNQGRGPAQLLGVPLLQLYPHVGQAGGLFDAAVQVLTTGKAWHGEGVALGAGVADIRIARLLDGVAIAWQRRDREVALLNHAQRLGQLGGWEENLATGEVTWTAQTFALLGMNRPVPLQSLAVHDPQAIDRLVNTAVVQLRPAVAVMRIDGLNGMIRYLRVFAEPVLDADGSAVAIRGACQDITTQYHPEFVLSATQDQLTEQRRLATQLQHAIIPPSTGSVRAVGLQVAVRYRPAGHEHLVGGDWYDVVSLPTDQVLLVVGDMAGHGIDVVTGMISMRNALRGLAMTGVRPGQLLSWLNTSARSLPEKVSGTVVCGLYDPATRELLWARAGHLPPLLVRDGQAIQLPFPSGPMLGAFADSTYEEMTTDLRRHDVLVLFTDGLVERPGADLDESVQLLMDTARHTVEDIEQYADQVLDHTDANTRDDTCLITLRVC